MHARLKYRNDRFATNTHVAERKQFESEINIGQFTNHGKVRIYLMIRFSLLLKASEGLLITFTICSWMFWIKLGIFGHSLSF